MKSLWAIVFLLFLLPFASNSQINHDGIPFYDFYPIDAYGLPQETWCISEDHRGFIYVASNKGLLEFDGSSWRTYATDNNSGVRTVCAQPSGRIYVGAVQTFGYFEPDRKGFLEYKSLCPLLKDQELDFSDVWQVKECNSYIYFHTMLKLFRYDPKDNSLVTIESKTDFQLMGCIQNELYVGQGSIGLCKVVDNSVVLVPGGDFFKDKIIYNILQYDNDNILVSDKFHFYIFNLAKGSLNKKLTNLFTKNLPFTDERFYIIFRVRGDRFGIATLNRGVYLLNKDGSFQKQFSIDNILPSNVSFYGMESRNGNIWIGLDNGVLKIENASPFSKLEYNRKNLISINSIAKFRNSLFYSSNMGLFTNSMDDKLKRKGNDFTQTSRFNFRYLALSYYQDIKNSSDSSLLVSTEEGIFIVKDNVSKPLTNKIVFLKALQSKQDPKIIFLSSNKGLAILKYPSYKFSDVLYIPQVKSVVLNIIEDSSGNVWVSTSTDGFYYLQRNNDKFKVLYHFKQTGEKSNIDYAYLQNNSIKYIYKNRLYSFNLKNYQITDCQGILPELLQCKALSLLYQYNDSTLWYFYLNEQTQIPCQIIGNYYPNYNSVFRRLKGLGIQNVYQESTNKAWFGTSNGVICAQNFIESEVNKRKPVVLIRKISVNNDSIIYNGSGNTGGYQFLLGDSIATIRQNLTYSGNGISITVTSPFLIAETNNQYSHFLKGYQEKWSEWGSSNSFDYKNLPDGSYTFYIKTRNVFGAESDSVVVNFIITPPWYRTIYTHLAGILLLTFIIMFIISRVQKKHKEETYKLENIITQRTSEINNQKTKIESQTKLLDISNKSIQQLSVVAQETDNPVIITDVNGEIEWVNKSFYRYFDYTSEDRVKFSQLCFDVDIEEKIYSSIQQKNPISFSGQFVTNIKDDIWFQITINPIKDEHDDVVNIIIVCSDITDVVELNKTRDLIISVITHDLKSPLLGFKMMAKSLSDNISKIEKSKLQEWVTSMHDNSSDIYELVENLTKWFKSQRGMITFLPIHLDLQITVNEVFSIFEPQATTKGIRLVNFIKDGSTIFADENMLRTILRNLLSNALKFSEMGIVCITSEENENEVIISVTDEGDGFDNQTKTKILSSDYTEGFGLLICKDFLQKNGGRLMIESNSEGSTISFALPNLIKQKDL
ncbi:MAG: PAS domain-containing protein [Bacteroidales bacterium]|nr:MAG: PAS domain-containing protein [Bacteroidales bacterium]